MKATLMFSASGRLGSGRAHSGWSFTVPDVELVTETKVGEDNRTEATR